MGQVLSINLPDPLMDRLNRLPKATDRPLEELVILTLDESIPRPPSGLSAEIRDELLSLEMLPDEELVEVAQSTLKAEEIQEPYTPCDAADRLALRKAYALVLLKWRGHPLPELAELSS